jgi:iron complex transport system permease protein
LSALRGAGIKTALQPAAGDTFMAIAHNPEKTLESRKPHGQQSGKTLAVLALLLVVVALGSAAIGSYPISLHDWWSLLRAPSAGGTVEIVLLQIRLPRLIACILVGSGLALAGSSYQGLFNNPMVSPDILGASAGAGLGAAVGILLGLDFVAIQALSFAGGLVAVLLAWALASGLCRRGDPVLMLVLVGILIGSMFTALISLTKYIADPMNKLPSITFWLLGSFASITSRDVGMASVPIAAGCIPLLLLRWRLNVLCMGEQEARMLGMNTRAMRFTVIVCATLITAASVSICGMVGWIGLVVPHLARMVVGPNHKYLLPAAAIMGGCFLLLVDDVARTAGTLEIPVGILTALIGAPFFLFLLMRERRQKS